MLPGVVQYRSGKQNTGAAESRRLHHLDFLFTKTAGMTVTASGPASSGDLVMIFMVAKIALLPYSAEEGPRMISICLIRFMSIGKSFPKYSM